METMESRATGTNCPKCGNASKRFGRHANGLQRYRCLSCRKTFTEDHEPSFRTEDYLRDPRGLTAIQLLLEGCSIRTAERMTGIRPATICKLLVIAGDHCERLMATLIQNVPATEVQGDEAWGFIAKKERNKGPEEAHNDSIGDCYVWVCLERNTKLVLSYSVGRRTLEHAMDLMLKLRRATSPDQRFQLTTDGLRAYVAAVDEMIGDRCDFAQLVKTYALPTPDERRYSPPDFVSAVPVRISGDPDPKRISTSHVERFNLTLRMGIRRMTRLTNGFSKKLENHRAAISLSIAYYNFCRIHQTLRVTPAMEAGITDHLWNIAELLS
jgi:transposase-like protein/IS1 family transposase